jgi:hypothetical protein
MLLYVVLHPDPSSVPQQQFLIPYYPKFVHLQMVMGNPSLGCGPDLDVAVQYVAEPVWNSD